MSTFVDLYGGNNIVKNLYCTRKSAKQALDRLEHSFGNIVNCVDMITYDMKKKESSSSSSSSLSLQPHQTARYKNAINNIQQECEHFQKKIIDPLNHFIRNDIMTIREIEEDVESFKREVSAQCSDIIYSNPPPPPEDMINLSIFAVSQTNRNSNNSRNIRKKSAIYNRMKLPSHAVYLPYILTTSSINSSSSSAAAAMAPYYDRINKAPIRSIQSNNRASNSFQPNNFSLSSSSLHAPSSFISNPSSSKLNISNRQRRSTGIRPTLSELSDNISRLST
jgi:hypothetical protein